MRYGIYIDGSKMDETNDVTYTFAELKLSTRYTLGVSRIVDGEESDVVTIQAKTLGVVAEEELRGNWYAGAEIEALHRVELGGKP